MDKLNLNNQIVLCRPAVRRAKVCIIRKKIKKLKLLQSCKKEEDKEKKHKRAERILEEIQLMKKVREDDVTKFALINKDIKSIIAKTKSNDHDHVYATLASHPDVRKLIEKTRDLFPSWEKNLPSLLESLGMRTMLKKYKIKNAGVATPLLPPNADDKSLEKVSEGENGTKLVDKALKPKAPKQERKVPKQRKKEEVVDAEEIGVSEDEIPEIKKVEEVKVVDSFFVDKKVIQPKLLSEEKVRVEKEESIVSESNKHWMSNNKRGLPRRDEPQKFSAERKPFRHEERPRNWSDDRRAVRSEPQVLEVEEKLHPSWAAKKAQVIKPFLGKKIKFDD